MLPAQNRNGFSAATLSSSVCALKRILLTNLIFSFFINLTLLTTPLYMMQIYNRVLPSHSESTLVMLTGLVCFTLAALAALETVRAQIMVRLGGKLELDLNQRVIDAAFLTALQSGERLVRQPLGDFDRIRSFIWSPVPAALFDIVWAPLFVLVVFLFHPLLGLTALGGSAVLLAMAVLHHLVTRPNLEGASRKAADANSCMERSLRNAQTLEAMGMLANLQQRWLRQRNESLQLQAKAADRTGLFAGVTKSVRFLLQVALLGCGALLVIDNQITPGAIVAASMLMARALAPLETAIGAWRQCVAVRGAYARLDALLRESPARQKRISLPVPRGALRLDDVVAWLPGSAEPTLRRVAFSLAPGDILAVVGASGSGKSTLARLIVGALPPYAGKIRLDNAEIQMWDRAELGPYLGYLPQEVELFEGTIAENIARFGELDSRKIVGAAQRAGVHDMILGLPQGYETWLGPSGGSLSGGQRQRIALARAMYGDPVLVVLDEPNSNLDSAGEQALADAIQRMTLSGTTVVLVSHRTKILRQANHMLMLRDGAATFVEGWQQLGVEIAAGRMPAVASRRFAGAS
jgi:ATP-binding cassette, subfamily C, bacterial exporter for protease/lipase